MFCWVEARKMDGDVSALVVEKQLKISDFDPLSHITVYNNSILVNPRIWSCTIVESFRIYYNIILRV